MRAKGFMVAVLLAGLSLALFAQATATPKDLDDAMWAKDYDIVPSLLLSNPSLANSNRPHFEHEPLFLYACCCTTTEIVRSFLDAGADPNARNNHNETALHRAAFGGKPQICELLINRGASVNARDDAGCTPLHSACGMVGVRATSEQLANRRAVAALLILRGADINARCGGKTALDRAEIEDPEMVSVLRKYGATGQTDTLEKWLVAAGIAVAIGFALSDSSSSSSGHAAVVDEDQALLGELSSFQNNMRKGQCVRTWMSLYGVHTWEEWYIVSINGDHLELHAQNGVTSKSVDKTTVTPCSWDSSKVKKLLKVAKKLSK